MLNRYLLISKLKKKKKKMISQSGFAFFVKIIELICRSYIIADNCLVSYKNIPKY